MPLEANALTTLASARRFLQKNGGETGQDAVIEDLINAASDEIQDEFEREFAPAGNPGVQRKFLLTRGPDNDGVYTLDVCPYDLRAVSAIKVDTHLDAAEQTTLTAADWALRPLPNREAVYQWIRLDNVPEGEGEREMTVTGTWGFATVPKNVEHWTNVTVAIWLRKDVAAFSTTLRAEEDRLERPGQLPTAVLEGLKKYRRWSTRVVLS